MHKRNVSSVVWVIVGILCHGLVSVHGLWCDRAPHGVNVPKTPGDNGFKIVISGDPDKPDKYIPGAVYTVRLQGPGDQYAVEKFSGFLLVAEPTDGLSPETSAGNFQLTKGDSFARFSDYCPHAVKHASEVPKAEVQVRWIAPPIANGCVSFRATIYKNKGQWFMDDDELTKQLCPESEVGQPDIEESEPCCACDEAKYELTFEGLWSPLTHPKDFPADAWSAHFSDIVGASHSPDFRFWQKNEPASEGLRQLAEAGDSRDLERELKDSSANIRTIIKARGLRHPNFFGHKTFAVFRADKDHNLISLVSKIAPSPDWFVGISGLNLCLRNGSWTDSRVIPLYPWDAGTNDGIAYLSERKPTIPRERISRIVWKNDPASPFYDPSGNMVKPFAKLRIQKQRSYDRPCEEGSRRSGPSYSPDWDEEEDSYEDKPECAVTSWSDWTPCTATCGKGVMTRNRRLLDDKAQEINCNRKLTDSRTCDAPIPCNGQSGSGSNDHSQSSRSGGMQINTREDPCAVTEYRAWGSCSKLCGRGIRRRLREFVDRNLADTYNCNHVKLVENDQCFGNARNCNEQEPVPPGCETTEWGKWGPCSAALCGTGERTRTRMYGDLRAYSIGCNISLMEAEPCTGPLPDCSNQPDAHLQQEICMLPLDTGKCAGSYSRWYFDYESKSCSKFKFTGCQGNRNHFETLEQCETICGSLKEISSDKIMGHHSYGYRKPYSNPRNSHTSTFPSTNKMSTSSSSLWNNDGPMSMNIIVDCEVSDYGPWGKCSVDCGRGHKYRIRYITRFPYNNGQACPKLEQRRKCKGVSCPANHPFLSKYPQYGQESYRFHDGYIN